MNYRILLLTLLVAFTAACAAPGQVETASEEKIEPAQQTQVQPAASASLPASVAEEKDLEVTDVQTTTPEPIQRPTPTEAPVLPVIGPAPGWDNEIWINSDGPLPLEDLRGKVVLLEFWTFG